MKVSRTKTFDKAFLKLPEHLQTKAEKAVKLWEARVDYQYRFTFTVDNDTIILRVIGNHDEVLKNP